MSAAPAGRPGVGVGVGVAVLAVVILVVLGGRTPTGDPFDVRSAAPDGYRALAMLLRERGASVRRTPATAMRGARPGDGDVVVVPAPELLSGSETRDLRDAAARGAVVVFGADRRPGEDPDGISGVAPGGAVAVVDPRTLADTAAVPARPGACDLAQLSDLGAVDATFADPVAVRGASSCYGDGRTALVVRVPSGRGAVLTVGSPYLWANARLQPDKENGGEPLDNAVMALRLLGPTADGATTGTRITFIDALPSVGLTPDGRRSPLELLPLGVRLAIAQLVAAFVLYAWWRARRLGAPVTERVPVPIAGSELVSAVGDLLRRRGSHRRAADVLRADARRELGRRLGVPPDAGPAAVAALVAARTGREPEQVAAALTDSPVDSAVALIRLTNTIDAIRQEVLHGHPVP